MRTLFQLSGRLAIHDQEGGYMSPHVSIDGRDFTAFMESFFRELNEIPRGKNVGQLTGTYRITLEQEGPT